MESGMQLKLENDPHSTNPNEKRVLDENGKFIGNISRTRPGEWRFSHVPTGGPLGPLSLEQTYKTPELALEAYQKAVTPRLYPKPSEDFFIVNRSATEQTGPDFIVVFCLLGPALPNV